VPSATPFFLGVSLAVRESLPCEFALQIGGAPDSSNGNEGVIESGFQ
jgi:hypothetical protein